MPQSTMFNEIFRVSSMKAAISISKFLKIPIGITIKPVEVMPLKEIKAFENPDEKTINIYLPIVGDIAGSGYFLFTQQHAFAICDHLFSKKTGKTQELFDVEISGLLEVANVVIGNFLTAFAQSFQLHSLMHKAPKFEYATLSETLKQSLASLVKNPDEEVVSMIFEFQHEDVKGCFLVILDAKQTKLMLKNISFPIDN